MPPSPLTLAATKGLRRIADQDPDPAHLAAALRHLAKWRAELVANTIAGRMGPTIGAGPFKGMAYGVRAAEGSRAARLLGVYEACLAPVIEAIIAREYPLVIDIGSAEGYYAVGLARRMPLARVLARDENPQAQDLCRALATQNGVQDRVQVGGIFSHADFAICTSEACVIICDIEGAEDTLLDPALAPGLTSADILVECHDAFHPGLTARLAARFSATHHVTRIDRALAPLPDWMEDWSDLDRLLALWEWRAGPTPWLWMTHK